MASFIIIRVIKWVADFWSGWSTQFLVLFSLALQVLLLFLAGVRRHRDGGVRVWILWAVYQVADYTVPYALGNLGASSARREHQLVAFWAPFLLLHLSGQDNIAAYQLEDNKLWARHILTLVAQALGAGYVLYKHISGGGGTSFSLAAACMAGVGFVKSWEKTWAFRRASLSIIRDSVRTERTAKSTFSLEYEEPPRRRWGLKQGGDKIDAATKAQREEFVKKRAHALFHVCKSAMVDSSVDDEDPAAGRSSNHGGSAGLLRGFENQDSEYSWELMETELSLMYDILYTKAAMVHTLPGYCIRAASWLAVAASLLLFCFSGKGGLSRADVYITYALVFGALLLETTSLLTALFSAWTFAFLCTTRWSWIRHAMLCSGRWDRFRRPIVYLHRLAYVTGIAGCLGISRRWHGTMGQCSLLDRSSRWGRAKPLRGHWAWLAGKLLGSSSVWTINVPQVVRTRVVGHIKRIVSKEKVNTLGVIRKNWGHVALNGYKDFKLDRDRYLGAEVQEGIVMWHIATDILLAHLGKLRTKDDTETDVGAIKAISQYLMFLLLKRPEMLPGLAQIKLYQRTEKTLADVWKGVVAVDKKQSYAVAALSPAISWIHRIYTTVMELRGGGGPNSCSRLQRRKKLTVGLPGNHQIQRKMDPLGFKSRVRFGVELAEILIDRQDDRQDSLKIVLDVWTDILVYTANRCSRESHAKQLAKGGEFTTLVWLMAEHHHQADYYTS